MHCINCSTQLPDEASFCWKCGKPQKSISQPSSGYASHQTEACEINWEATNGCLQGFLGFPSCGYFVAKAIGPNGVYVAGKTKKFWLGIPLPLIGMFTTFPNKKNKRDVAYHETLISHLVKEGWNPVMVSSST